MLIAGAVFRTRRNSAGEERVSGGRWALPTSTQSLVFRQFADGHRHGRLDEPVGVLSGGDRDAGVLLPADPAGGGRTSSQPRPTVPSILQGGAAFVAVLVATRCFRRKPSQVDGRNQGRILVLGIRGSSARLCHNSKLQAIFRDSGGKPGLVLGLLGGASKEITLATLSVSVEARSANSEIIPEACGFVLP